MLSWTGRKVTLCGASNVVVGSLRCAYGPDNALVRRVYAHLEEVARVDAARDD